MFFLKQLLTIEKLIKIHILILWNLTSKHITVRSSASEAIIDQGLRDLHVKVYNYMGSALLLTGFCIAFLHLNVQQ